MSIILLFTGAIMIVGAVVIASRSKDDVRKFTESKNEILTEVKSIEASVKKIADEVQGFESRFTQYNAQLLHHEKKFDSLGERLDKLDKKIDAVEHVARMPKSMSLKMSEPVRVQLIYKQAAAKNKPLEKSRQQLLKETSRKIKELSQ